MTSAPGNAGTGVAAVWTGTEWLMFGGKKTDDIFPEFSGVRVTPNVYTTLDEVDLFADRVLVALRKGLA